MMRSVLNLALVCLLTAVSRDGIAAEVSDNLRDDQVAAWCIVPFDAKKRGPAERAAMLKELGIRRCAYDWRQEHVPSFEDEILEYQKNGIEFFAFWGQEDSAFELFQKYDLHPQIWQTAPAGAGATEAEKIAEAAAKLEPLAQKAAAIGSQLGLYNHGGWGGEPENLVAVCRQLRAMGNENVGIVYNFHHGHGHIEDWAAAFAAMKPYLLCLNLNGMVKNGEEQGKKIVPLAQGDEELAMLKVVVESGYDGPIGILDHRPETDSAETLAGNLRGLDWLRKELAEPGSGGAKPKTDSSPPPSAKEAVDSLNPAFGKALAGGMVVQARQEIRQPPLTVECRVRLNSKATYNIIVASEPKSSATHWEIFSMNGSGKLTAYFPGLTPDHVRSEIDICDGKWHAVAMQYSADKVMLWLDGKVVAEEAVTRKPGDQGASGELAFGRLVERNIGSGGMIDEVRITRGLRDDLETVATTPGGAESPQVLGYWNFDDLAATEAADRRPLEPEANPYWEHTINRDRIYDFYAKQARHFGEMPKASRPEILPQFPGIDGGTMGHWGNQNDQDTWKDGRVRDMDHGSLVSGVFRGGGKTIPRGVSVKLDEKLCAVFDPTTLNYEVAWTGNLVAWSDVRRGFMQGTPMGGEKIESPITKSTGKGDGRYLGFYRHGDQVIFSYERDGKTWLDSATAKAGVATRVVEPAEDSALAKLIKGGPANWPERLVTKGTMGKGSPYAIDTLTLPYENPWKALFFVSGIDFLPGGRIAICTIHGDVWLCDVSDENLSELTWKRFAAGLHQPLGLKVSDGVIHVMGRNQITALHDLNGDDEADFYECVSAVHETSPGGHDFITGLERDDEGRWYFASGNQGVCRVSADGQSLEVLATGFRNPNGLGITPDGKVVLTSVQEGDWTPTSAVCDVSQGGHHGAGGPKEGALGYVPPMLYFPRGVDNSSGGPTHIDSDRWGPVKGNWLHFSGGFCTAFLMMREVIDGQTQGMAVTLPGEFLSGAHRARFSPDNGQLYVVGAQGWGNYGTADGSLQRVRLVAIENFPYPISYETRDNGILLTFADPVSDELAEGKRWFAQQWNYRYGPAYGSPEFSARHPGTTGHDPVEILSVHRLDGGKR
ncbi:MAG: TIM barrel protein, partial [Verrucomicrobiae bacterium]|nr:TIM barrel protein [Verrucomicrobiae bacterium]